MKDEISEIKERVEDLNDNLSFNSVSQIKRQYEGVNSDVLIVLIVVSNGVKTGRGKNNIGEILKGHILKSRGELGLKFEDPFKDTKRGLGIRQRRSS